MQHGNCLNCGTPLEGPFCHACGQPVKGMIRHFKSIVADFLDTVLEYDSRIWRTLLPLYFQPGRLTRDFVAGKRMRFVTPFRLAFVLLVLAFLVLQLVVAPVSPALTQAGQVSRMLEATTVAEVEAARDRALASLDEVLAGEGGDVAAAQVAAARATVEEEATRRIEWLNAASAAREQGLPPPPEPTSGPIVFFGDDADAWDAETNPLVVDWLPAFVNRQINAWIGQARANVQRAQEEPGRFVDSFLGLLPAVLFALMPIFALLLKLFYIRSRRLYMEHMVVTLHSHSFLAMAIIIAVVLGTLAQAVPAGLGLQTAIGVVYSAALAWIPIYILLMQRHVYAQSWPLTVVKFAVIGLIYNVLVVAAVTVAVLVTLVRG
jgi:hypothetical protein